MNKYVVTDINLLTSGVTMLPLIVRTLIYLAAGAAGIADKNSMRQFSESGRFFSSQSSSDESAFPCSEELVS